MSNINCENCKWYKYITIATGRCTRYRDWKTVAWSHYCGEFKERDWE